MLMTWGKRLPPDFWEDPFDLLPRIHDYTPEGQKEKIRKAMRKQRRFSVEDYYQIVQMRDQEKLSWRAIGKRLGVSYEAARKAYHKAKKALA